MNKPFHGKTVVITGAAKGIGRACALHFAELGACLHLVDSDWKMLKYTETHLPKGCGAALHKGDVSDAEAVLGICSRINTAGSVDVLINNAAVSIFTDMQNLSVDEWDRILNINLRAPFLFARQLSPAMLPGSSIINIASTRALMSEPNTEAYSASKGGIVSLTHALAVSLAVRRIRVNCISPGWIDVSAWQGEESVQAELSREDHAQHPAGRVGIPEDIAETAAFLAGDAAGFITGQNIVVDGGMTKRMIYHEEKGAD